MKHIIILLLFGLGSCHVHYHIEPKEPIKEQPKRGIILTSNHWGLEGCGVPGCLVYHEGTSYINNLNSN